MAKNQAPARSEQEILVDTVMEALCMGGRLPDQCSAMLKAMAPHSLATPSDERASSQTAVVDMIGEAVDDLYTAKTNSAVAEADALRAAEVLKVELDSAVAAADASLVEKACNVKSKDEDLCLAESNLAEANAALATAKETARLGGEAHVAREQELEDLKTVVAGFESIKAGDDDDDASCARKLQAVCAAAGRLNLEGSLLTSLPLALAKKRQDRGRFDDVVVQEVERVLGQEADNLRKAIEDGLPAAAERASAVAAAQAHVDAAEVGATENRQEFAIAREAKSDQKRVKDDAITAVSSHAALLKHAVLVRKDAEASRDTVAEVLSTFKGLRDRSSKPPMQVEVEAVEQDSPDAKPFESSPPVLDASTSIKIPDATSAMVGAADLGA